MDRPGGANNEYHDKNKKIEENPSSYSNEFDKLLEIAPPDCAHCSFILKETTPMSPASAYSSSEDTSSNMPSLSPVSDWGKPREVVSPLESLPNMPSLSPEDWMESTPTMPTLSSKGLVESTPTMPSLSPENLVESTPTMLSSSEDLLESTPTMPTLSSKDLVETTPTIPSLSSEDLVESTPIMPPLSSEDLMESTPTMSLLSSEDQKTMQLLCLEDPLDTMTTLTLLPQLTSIEELPIILKSPIQNERAESTASNEETIQNIKNFLQSFVQEIEEEKFETKDKQPAESCNYFRPISASSCSQEPFLGFPPSSPKPSCSYAPLPEAVPDLVPSGSIRVASFASTSNAVKVGTMAHEQCFRQLIEVFPQRKPAELKRILLDHGNDLDRAIDSILQPQRRKRKSSTAKSSSVSAETITQPIQSRPTPAKRSKNSSKSTSLERYKHVFNIHPDIIINKDTKTYYIIPGDTKHLNYHINGNTEFHNPPNINTVEKETHNKSEKRKTKKSKRKKSIFTSTTLFTRFVEKFFETMKEFYGTCGKSLLEECAKNAEMLRLLKKNSNVLKKIIKLKTAIESGAVVSSISETINQNVSSTSTGSIPRVSENNIELIVISPPPSEQINARNRTEALVKREPGIVVRKYEPDYNLNESSINLNTIIIDDEPEVKSKRYNKNQNQIEENKENQNLKSENIRQEDIDTIEDSSASESKLQIDEDSDEYDSTVILQQESSNEAVNSSSIELNVDTDETNNTPEAENIPSPPSPFVIYSRSQTFNHPPNVHYTSNNEMYEPRETIDDEPDNVETTDRTTFQDRPSTFCDKPATFQDRITPFQERPTTALPVSEDHLVSNSMIEAPNLWNLRRAPNIGRVMPLNHPNAEINYVPNYSSPPPLISRFAVPTTQEPIRAVQSALRTPAANFNLRNSTPAPNFNIRTPAPVENYNLEPAASIGNFNLSTAAPPGNFNLCTAVPGGNFNISTAAPVGNYNFRISAPIGSHNLTTAVPVGNYNIRISTPIENHNLTSAAPERNYNVRISAPVGNHNLPTSTTVGNHNLTSAAPLRNQNITAAPVRNYKRGISVPAGVPNPTTATPVGKYNIRISGPVRNPNLTTGVPVGNYNLRTSVPAGNLNLTTTVPIGNYNLRTYGPGGNPNLTTAPVGSYNQGTCAPVRNYNLRNYSPVNNFNLETAGLIGNYNLSTSSAEPNFNLSTSTAVSNFNLSTSTAVPNHNLNVSTAVPNNNLSTFSSANCNIPVFSQQFPIRSKPLTERLNFTLLQINNAVNNPSNNFGMAPPSSQNYVVQRNNLAHVTFPNNLATPFDLSLRRVENNPVFRFPANNELSPMFPSQNHDRTL